MANTRSGGSTTSEINVRVALRRRRAFELRKEGKPFYAIADTILTEMPDACPASWGQRTAFLDVQAFIDAMRAEVSESLIEVVAIENDRLDALLAAAWPRAMKGDVRSIEVCLRIQERRAKMLGLDSAIKVDWRVELSGLLDAKILTTEEIRSQLGDELFASFMQFRAEALIGPDVASSPLLTGGARQDNQLSTPKDFDYERRRPVSPWEPEPIIESPFDSSAEWRDR